MDGFLYTAECAVLLKAMADPTRLSILRCLVGGERSVTELARVLQLPQPAVSHHLAILRHAQLLTQTRDGRKVIYRLHPSATRHLGEGEDIIELGCCSVSLRKP